MASTANVFALSTMGDGLERVRTLLGESVQSPDELLTEISAHLLDATGPRIRPALALAAAAMGSDEQTASTIDAVRGATSVELVHIGTAYHDDVIVDATNHNDVRSVNEVWGELHAILAGDFLLARSGELAARLGTEVAALLAQTISRICEGQVCDLTSAFDLDRTVDSYLRAVDGKTAALMSTSCRIGALAGGQERSTVDAVTVFGTHFGMAHQIAADLVDLLDDGPSGVGDDLTAGVYTLPVVRALAGVRGDDLRQLLQSGPDGVAAARETIRSNGAVSESVPLLRSHVDQAIAALDDIDDCPQRAGLAATAAELLTATATALAT